MFISNKFPKTSILILFFSMLFFLLILSSCTKSSKPAPTNPIATSPIPSNPIVSTSAQNSESSIAKTPSKPATTIPKPTSSILLTLEQLEAEYQKAYNLFHNGKYSESIKICNIITSIDPTNFKALNIKGIALCFSDNFKEGMQSIDKSLQISPNYWYSRFNKGLAYSYNKQFDNAILWYNNSLELENYVWSHYGKAAVYAQKNDLSNTISSLQIAINMDSSIKQLAKSEKDFDLVKNKQTFKDLLK